MCFIKRGDSIPHKVECLLAKDMSMLQIFSCVFTLIKTPSEGWWRTIKLSSWLAQSFWQGSDDDTEVPQCCCSALPVCQRGHPHITAFQQQIIKWASRIFEEDRALKKWICLWFDSFGFNKKTGNSGFQFWAVSHPTTISSGIQHDKEVPEGRNGCQFVSSSPWGCLSFDKLRSLWAYDLIVAAWYSSTCPLW